MLYADHYSLRRVFAMYRHDRHDPAARAFNSTASCPAFDVDEVITELAHWLPSQRPLKDFIHHNTLHALQQQPFHQAIAIAAKLFGAYSYLPLADYQAAYQSGRISDAALNWAIAQAEPDSTRHAAWRAALFAPQHAGHYPPLSLANHGIRAHWLNQIEVNLNALVQPVLFRLLANFLDQGISRWTLARNGTTFLECLQRLATDSLVALHPFSTATARAWLAMPNPDVLIQSALQRLVGDTRLYKQYLLEMLLAHPGWSGMVSVIEHNPNALLAKRRISLKEVIALELALECAFVEQKCGADFSCVAHAPNLARAERLEDVLNQTAVPVPQRIWHEAFEYALHSGLLSALAMPPHVVSSNNASTTPAVQALFCLDDRECSLRRHLEALNPGIATYGAAGFFGIDFLYQGVDDAYAVAQCPVVVSPKHLVVEAPLQSANTPPKTPNGEFAKLRRQPNSLLRGWLFTQTLGLGYAARLAWDVFKPGAQLLNIRQLGEVDAHTHLHLLRTHDAPDEQGRWLGFSHAEMADKLEGLLRIIGLTQNFAPLVVVVAHGSSSVNNPHFAAYDCGACAGKPGAPNARAFAWMANDATVRALLRTRGIDIPDHSYFVAALHNTSCDEITYFDSHLWGDQAPTGLSEFQDHMREALRRNAHERCRWFELGPQSADAELAHQHVRARAASIFEPRPELNHSNNLYCIIGRRRLTRDLFMDRRAFLHSYDPLSDLNGERLLKILNAVIPVCGGINLEYLFSRIDNSVYGAGTKLPHNVIGLFGVANGVEGDLRTGLPSQMIEVHEPARLLIVVEQSCAVIDEAYQNLGEFQDWLKNDWVRLVSCHPETRELNLYRAQGWQRLDMSAFNRMPAEHSSAAILAEQRDGTLPVRRLI